MDLESNIIDSFRKIVQGLRLSSLKTERETGVSGAQYFVLQVLMEQGTLTINELAKFTHTHQSSVSVVVSRLKEQGYVTRVRNREDARKFEISLSRSGISIFRKRRLLAQTRLFSAVENMNVKDKKQLSKLLKQVVKDAQFDCKTPNFFFEEK